MISYRKVYRGVMGATAMLFVMSMLTEARAYEFGQVGWSQKPGLTLGGATAETPPAGIYMFQQFFTYQSTIVGPGAPEVGGASTPVRAAAEGTGFLFVPGWSILGATYDAVLVQASLMAGLGNPINENPAGMINTYLVPAELSWKLGDSGFYVKTGLGIYLPDGSISGPAGLNNVGNPWWTFQPELIVSYLKDGWNLTANVFYETHTQNSITKYRSGDLLHTEFTATKNFGRWTVGPVGYYLGQVTSDSSSAFYNNAINVNRYGLWAAGLLVGYDFGPCSLDVWALDEFSAHASGGTAATPGIDSASITKGYTVFAQLSFRLWAPDQPSTPKLSNIFHK